MAYILPSFGAQYSSKESARQSSPLLNKYSPRLFGSPPQLTNLCDMRSLSSDGDNPGAVGDFYMNDILRDAQVANFVVGRAMFTGGYNSVWNSVRMLMQYAYALQHYQIYDDTGSAGGTDDPDAAIIRDMELDAYINASDVSDADSRSIQSALTGTPDGATPTGEWTEEQLKAYEQTMEDNETVDNYLTGIGALIGGSAISFLKSSLNVQQPFYTFDADWYTYINNVKMMINSAVIMLGLQSACVRIGDYYYPIGMNADENRNSDVWSNYRFITPNVDTVGGGVGMATSINNQKGDTNQYVSFMVTPVSETESYQNDIGDSLIYSSVLNQGNASGIGQEIAFISNSTQSIIDDPVVTIAGGAISSAEAILSNLAGGIGRFTASVFGGLAKSFVGDHSIYPKIFKQHESHSSMTLTVKLRASRGDAYSYLTEILVPMFHVLGMALPKMSQYSSASYCYPPIIQCSIPGVWGTRLGMIESLEFQKNPDGGDYSVNGYPLAVNISIRIVDLQHCMVTSPMNNPALFLNNHTMFDYIAQCCGVDKYRVNGSMRLVTKLALAASYSNPSGFIYNLGSSVMNDFTTLANKLTRTSDM